MDDFLVFDNLFKYYMAHLASVLRRYEDYNLILYFENCHFMVKKKRNDARSQYFKERSEVDKVNNEVNEKISPLFSMKVILSFLGNVGLIVDSSRISPKLQIPYVSC